MHEPSEPGGVRIVDHGPSTLREWRVVHLYELRVLGDEGDGVVLEMRKARLGGADRSIRTNLHALFANSANAGLCHSDQGSRELLSLPPGPQQATLESDWVRPTGL